MIKIESYKSMNFKDYLFGNCKRLLLSYLIKTQ